MVQAIRSGTRPSASAGGEVPVSPRGAKERDPLFDNAKYIAILLVVVGHSLAGVGFASHFVQSTYAWIYLFHMPVFVVIAGYFSKRFDYSPRRMRSLLTGVAVPCVIFEIAYVLFMRFVGGAHLRPSLDPYWLLWFLVALFIWRMSSGIWRQVRFPVAVAVVISLGVGLVPVTSILSIDRALAMLPFFVLGMSLEPRHFALLGRPLARALAVVVLACAFAVAYVAAPHMSHAWFQWDQSYAGLHVSAWVGLGVRAGLMVCSFALVASFLALMPRRRAWFTALGTGTLFAYLLHGFLIRGVEFAGWFDYARSPLGMVVVVLAAATVGTLLMTPPVRKAFGWAVEPTLGWAFRADHPEKPAPADPVTRA